MGEVRVAGAGGEDQEVVVQLAVVELQTLVFEVNGRRLSKEYTGVALVAKDRANRRGDLGRREGGGSNLVEQGLEEVMVATVDEGNADRLPGERSCGVQAPEPATDDDDVGPVLVKRLSSAAKPVHLTKTGGVLGRTYARP